MNMAIKEQVLRYKHLREKGLSEEDAVESLSFDNKNEDCNVSTKDLKIAFLELKEELNPKFNEINSSINNLNRQMKFIFWALGGLVSIMLSGFGICLTMMFDILSRLPK